MKRNAIFASILTLLVAITAQAVTYDVKVAFDTDRNTATGCTITTPRGSFAGAEQVLITRVDVSGGTASTLGTTRQACVGGVFASAVPGDTHTWAAGLSTAGNLFIETHITPADLGVTVVTPMRVAFFVNGGALNDAVMSTRAGTDILFPLPGRHRAVAPTDHTRTIILDGADGDWNGISAIAGGGSGTADLRIMNGYAFGGTNDLFFAVRAQANHAAPTAAGDTYNLPTVGGTLNVPATTGVLANDSDPNHLPLNALLVAGVQHGTLTLNANGSFDYTHDGSSAPVDSFEYKATNGTLESNVAQVQIGIGAGGGPEPPPAPKFTSADHVTFIAGQFNSFTVTTTPAHPTSTITIAGALPNGVTFKDNGDGTATISGVPNPASGGVYTFGLTATNVVGTANQVFTLTVNQSPSFVSPSAVTFTTGQLSTFNIAAVGFPTPSITMSGTLPSGLTFHDNGGGNASLSGTPAAGTGGIYTLLFTATNVVGSASQTFTLTVNQPPSITSASSTIFTVGTPGTFTVTVGGFPSPTVVESGALPAGVTFNSVTRILSGTPGNNSAGSYPITFTASNGVGAPAVQNFTLNVVCPTIVLTPASLPAGTATQPYSQTFGATGGNGAYTFSLVSGALPAGLNLAGAVLSGTPTVTGTFNFSIKATDSLGCSATTAYSLVINCPAITVNPASLPNGAQGVAYNQTLTATGGVGAYTLSTTPANLPPGLSLSSAGALTGTPTTAGTFNFTVTATDANGCSGSRPYTVLVCVTPSVTISATQTTFCAGTNVTFTATPVNGGAAPIYQWKVNGNNAGTNSPTFSTSTLANGDQVTVTMTSNASPCTTVNPVTSNTVTVTVNPNPATPTITPTPAQVCANSVGNTASGPVGATTYAWSIAGGIITSATNAQNVTYTAGASGTVDLTLTVTNASGCPASKTVSVTINPTPATPAITALPPQVCANSTGNTASGPAGATTYAWSIAGGTITSGASAQTVTYTAGASGTVDLTLTVTNAAGCSASNTANVTINANPAAPAITPTPSQVCANSAGNTASGPAGATSYAWSIAGGTITSAANAQSVTYTAGASGTIGLTLVVTNASGCSASSTINVPINANPATPAITATPAQVCANSTGNTASGPAGATTYAWSIAGGTITSASNGQNVTYTAGASGTVDLTLVVTNASGCSASNTVNVTINANPAAPAITPTPAQVCANSTGNTASGPAGATTYAWSIAGGTITSAANGQNITYTAGASGTVDLTLVVTNASGCSASTTINVPINANPAAPAITPTPSQVCANSAGNTASGPAGATSYAWSIANGTITSAANAQNVTYTAGPSGTVDLTLVVTNASGCSASSTINVPINAAPAAPAITATPSQVCANSTGNTASGPAGATSYAWSIAGGTITSAANGQNVTYTAGASGTVDLTLVVTNASGCSASSTVNVPINANPSTPTITPTTAVCGGSTGNVANGPAGATSYAWSIAGGTITSATNGQSITYTAGASGTVDLTLVVTNGAGCSASNTVNITINPSPSAPTITPTPATVCENSTGNTATGPAGAASYAWAIVNGVITSAANAQSVTYTAGASGTVDLTLTVTNGSGCGASSTVNVPISAAPATPAITATPSQVCANSTGNTASGPAGATSYAWSIAGGMITSAANTQSITYTAGASGTVDLTLTVTNAAGCATSNTLNVTINAAPAAPAITATPSQVCANSTGNTASGPAGATSYAWSIAGGTITSATNTQSITYTAGASGTVDLTLVVTNGAGCSASSTLNVTINANPSTPTITPTPAQVCENSTGNTATGPAGAASYAWSISNGTITSATNAQSVTYTAGASGQVGLTLVVTNASGCSATNTVNVTINAKPATPAITPTPAAVCGGSTGNSASGPAGATSYAWSIVNGAITSAANAQTVTYTAGPTGTVDLTLVVTNASGCSATNTVNVPINDSPAAPTITPNPAQVCANSTGNTADGPAGATTYAWSISNGTITSATNAQSITYTAGPSGQVGLTLVVTNASGCSASSSLNVTINANPAAPTITPTPAQVCADSTGNTASGPAGATTYAWSISNGTITSATNAQSVTYTAGASGQVGLTLVVTNASGCSATSSVNVTINANPATPAITPTPSPVCGGSTGNSASGPAGATSYAWSIVNGTITSAANTQNITYTAGPTGTVDLTLVVTNASGCSATNTVNVPINPSPATPVITVSSEVCANTTGNSASGPAGATTYAWTITNGAITSATNIQTITWTAPASGTVQLQLTVTNASGCPASNTANVAVNPAVTLLPAAGTLPNAVYHTGYTQNFTAGGGTPGFTYSISPGAPSGLSFNTSTGVLSGAGPTLPNSVGVFNFTVTATDTKGCSVTQSYTLHVLPHAVNDTYSSPNAVGNTQAMTTAYSPAPTTPKVTYSGTILDNDESSAAMTVSAGAACNSGTIAYLTNGNWLYTPAVGFTGTATCGYTLTSNGETNTANVVITISNKVWYVDPNSGVAGDGRSNTPFNNTSGLAPSGQGAAGDIIYIYNGPAANLASKITLLANQSLVGEGVALSVNTVTLRAAGTKPTITNSTSAAPRDVVVVNNGNTITGVALTSSQTSGALITGSPNALTFSASTATISSAAMGINLTGGTGAVAISNVTFSGTGTGDMIKSNTGDHVWSFTSSPITQTNGRALNATNRTGGSMTWDSNSPVTVSAGSQDGAITLTANSGGESFTFNKKVALTMTGSARAVVGSGTITGSLSFMDNTSTVATATGASFDIQPSSTATALNITLQTLNVNGAATGMILSNTGGSFTVNGTSSGLATGTGGSMSNITNQAVRLIGCSGTVDFKSMNFGITNAALYNVYVDNNSAGALTANFTGCQFTGVTASVNQQKALLQYEAGAAAAITASVQNCYFNGSRTYGLFATGAGTSNVNVTVNQCGFGTNVNSGAAVNKPGSAITNAPAFGLGITNGASAHVTYSITNNTFWGANGALGAIYAVTISGAGSTTATSTLNGTINNNQIGKSGTTGSGCSSGCAGIGLLPGNQGTFNATVTNNDIRQVNADGISLVNSISGASMNIIGHINSNVLAEPDTTGSPLFQRGIAWIMGNSGGTSNGGCLEMSSNNITGSWTAGRLIRVSTANTTGTLTMPGLTPTSGANSGQVETFIGNQNPPLNPSNIEVVLTGAINGSASPCP